LKRTRWAGNDEGKGGRRPISDPTTHYRIEVRGRVDREWLQSVHESAEIVVDCAGHREERTVVHVTTDQAGIVGLVRRLHGVGMTIQQFQIVIPP